MAKQKKKTSTSKSNRPSGRQMMLSRILIGLAVIFCLTYIASIFTRNKTNNSTSSISSSNNNTASSNTNSQTANIQFRKDAELEFLLEEGNKKIDIEIVDQEATIQQGLMYRRTMAENQGMLFKFPNSEMRSFWMKNTYLPLDIIYVDSQKKVVSIQKNTTPLSTQSLPSTGPAQYVVEVNAGFCDAYGIGPGTELNF